MNQTTVLAFGHSHLGALSMAYVNGIGRLDLPYDLTTYQFLQSDRPQIVNTDGKGWHYHPEIERDVLELIDTIEPGVVAIMMHGEQAVAAGLIAPSKPYDFYFPWETGYIPNAASEIIPFDLLLQVYIARYRLIADFIDLIRDKLPPVTFALSPPPPVGDRKFVIDSDVAHGDISSHIRQHGLPATTWRQRIWKINTMAMCSVYNARGIGLIDPPAGTADEEGCLRPEFRSDVFHANLAYGERLLQQIGDLVAQTASAPESGEL